MLAGAQRSWKFSSHHSSIKPLDDDSEQAEVQTATTVQLLQRRSQRRASMVPAFALPAQKGDVAAAAAAANAKGCAGGAGEDPQQAEELRAVLSRLEKDLKGQLTEMDKKLDGLVKKVAKAMPENRQACGPRPPVPALFSRIPSHHSFGNSRMMGHTRSMPATRQVFPLRRAGLDVDMPGPLEVEPPSAPWGRAATPGAGRGRSAEDHQRMGRLSVSHCRSEQPCVRFAAAEAQPHLARPAVSRSLSEQRSVCYASEGSTTAAAAHLPLQKEDEVATEGSCKSEASTPSGAGIGEMDRAHIGERERRRASDTSSASSRVGHILREKMSSVYARRSQLSQDIWNFLEEADSSRAAFWFARAMQILVVVNVMLSVVQSQKDPLLLGIFPICLQIFFDLVFAAEVLTRFAVCPNKTAFFLSPFNWVDLVSACMVAPRISSLFLPTSEAAGRSIHEFLHLIVPVVWLLKLLRSFEKFHLLCSAFVMAFEALPVLLFTLTIIVLSFSATIYFVEPRENIEAFPRAIWFVLVTMTTVGYGDVVPQTSAGSMVVSALIIGSQLYMAIPLGIVGGSFSRVWEDREQLLLLRRTRTRLLQWGYTPDDILALFYIYDREKTGELDLYDFSRMVKEMRLGLDPQRIQNLFKAFDANGSGKVDHEEFVGVLYPNCGLFSTVPPSPNEGISFTPRHSHTGLSNQSSVIDEERSEPGDESELGELRSDQMLS